MFLKHLLVFLTYLLLQPVGLVVSQTTTCEILQPCGDRGECVDLKLGDSSNILSTECGCKSNYTGRWCQFFGKYENKVSVKLALFSVRQSLW